MEKEKAVNANLLALVMEARAGNLQRYDCKIESSGVPFDVSIYRMNEYLVRVDFKKPKSKRSSK